MPHHPAKAKRVILLFSTGGVSHMDTFDHKPKLFKADGKMLGVGGGLSLEKRPLLKPRWQFRPGGKCGTLVSDLFPHIRQQMDNICLIRSMTTDSNEHFQATLAIHTGSFFVPRPEPGRVAQLWPGHDESEPAVVRGAGAASPVCGHAGLGQRFSACLPPGDASVAGRRADRRMSAGSQQPRRCRRWSLAWPTSSIATICGATATISSWRHGSRHLRPLFSMQFAAPDAFDLSKESDETLRLYGLKRGDTQSFGWQCLVARRLAERGVRFIELIDSGSSNNWDSHGDMAGHVPLAKKIDQPIAGLLQDLEAAWSARRHAGRSGRPSSAARRAPMVRKGRGHHPAVFSSWLAGGGVKGGIVHGESDDIGATVAHDKVHVHDFHATILHLLGFDHEKLTYRHAGRDFRLTDVSGRVIQPLLT